MVEAAARWGVPVPVERWGGDGPALDAAAHAARLQDLLADPAGRPAGLATDGGQMSRMVGVAGEVVAWTARSAGGEPFGASGRAVRRERRRVPPLAEGAATSGATSSGDSPRVTAMPDSGGAERGGEPLGLLREHEGEVLAQVGQVLGVVLVEHLVELGDLGPTGGAAAGLADGLERRAQAHELVSWYAAWASPPW